MVDQAAVPALDQNYGENQERTAHREDNSGQQRGIWGAAKNCSGRRRSVKNTRQIYEQRWESRELDESLSTAKTTETDESSEDDGENEER